MKIATLCLLIRNGKLLLGKKQKKIGKGKWNGCGGGIEPGETIKAGAVREILEETGLTVAEEDLEAAALISFYAGGEPTWKVHVFLVHEWTGEPKDTDEMRDFKEFSTDALPFDDMLPGDREWMPLVLSGRKIQAGAWYDTSTEVLELFSVSKTEWRP